MVKDLTLPGKLGRWFESIQLHQVYALDGMLRAV